MTTARNNSGCRVSIAPISSPPFEPPIAPRRRGLGDLAADQILRDGDEILESPDPVVLQRGAVPGGTELAAAADIGDRINAALFEPQFAERAGVGRGQRHLKPAIAVKQCRRRAIERQPLGAHDRIGNRSAIRRHRLELLDDKVGGNRNAAAVT